MPDFSAYDSRHYETANVVDGYNEWSKVYDERMVDRMDRPLLERLDFDWNGKEVLDLACGTGRVGAYLRDRGARAIDGVDLTPGMLEHARAKNIYRRLELGDVTETRLPSHTYDAIVQVLACEHLPRLDPLYDEAARLAKPGAAFVLIGYHPCFMLRGIPTHFERDNGENLAIRQWLHFTSDHVNTGCKRGFTLAQMEENLVDDPWVAQYPNYAKHRGWPITFAMLWSKR
jgi:SAM-dependent methyltransferase